MSPHAQLKENGGSKELSKKVLDFLKARKRLQQKVSKRIYVMKTENLKKPVPVVFLN